MVPVIGVSSWAVFRDVVDSKFSLSCELLLVADIACFVIGFVSSYKGSPLLCLFRAL